MRIRDIDNYFGKTIKVISVDGLITTGELYGYNYDFDEEGREFLEFDIEEKSGQLVGFTEDEVEHIEII